MQQHTFYFALSNDLPPGSYVTVTVSLPGNSEAKEETSKDLDSLFSSCSYNSDSYDPFGLMS